MTKPYRYKQIMKQKIKIWIICILITPIIAGLYGIIHDCITYSIAPEYYTNFKFIQFQIPEYFRSNELLGITIVGFLATWWTGLPIGIILGGYGIWKKDVKFSLSIKFKSIILTLLITLIIGVIGFL